MDVDSLQVILGNERSGLRSGVSSTCGISGPYRSLFVLLFCKIGGRKLWKNERLHVQLQLAGFAKPNTQILYHHDWECTTPSMLCWIQISCFEFGHILFGKYSELVLTFDLRWGWGLQWRHSIKILWSLKLQSNRLNSSFSYF